MDLPLHGVYVLPTTAISIKWHTKPIWEESLYTPTYFEPLYIDDRGPARPNHAQGRFITPFPGSVGFGDRVIVGYQKMQIIKVTILLKNEVKIWKISKKYKNSQIWQYNEFY